MRHITITTDDHDQWPHAARLAVYNTTRGVLGFPDPAILLALASVWVLDALAQLGTASNGRLRDIIEGISLGDHMGDVNRYLSELSVALGCGKMVWDEPRGRMVWEPVKGDGE